MTEPNDDFKIVKGSTARFVELLGMVKQWGDDRGIYYENGATVTGQALKLIEEAKETSEAASAGAKLEIIDGIGDCLVVLIQMCRLARVPLDLALLTAWEEIRNRKGRLIQGVFVKQSDLERLEAKDVDLDAIESPQHLERLLGKI